MLSADAVVEAILRQTGTALSTGKPRLQETEELLVCNTAGEIDVAAARERMEQWGARGNGGMKAMTKKTISGGVVHNVPTDLRRVLISDPAALSKWEDITPLARNEWICWVTSVKKPETRRQHIERVRTELKEGMRRPCCWPGCPHR